MRIVLDFNDIKHINYHQASINLDACFILAYFDFNDYRGDRVAEILNKWSKDKVKNLVISTYVLGEVIHNLFKNLIREDIVNLNNKNYSELVGDVKTVDRMLKIVPKDYKNYFKKTDVLNINVDTLMKEFKRLYPSNRVGLDIYYNEAVDKFSEFINYLYNDLNIEVITPPSDTTTKDLALLNMRIQQLSIYDAYHIAITSQYQFDYFATLDGDFEQNYYSKNESQTEVKIIKIA